MISWKDNFPSLSKSYPDRRLYERRRRQKQIEQVQQAMASANESQVKNAKSFSTT